MTRKTRTILFFVCLFLFLLIAPSVVFYSQGYRFDFENKKISQTGGLFLKVLPKSVEIYLNDKPRKKTDFFFGSALIENLLPKKYKVLVRKDGYQSWEKNLEIKAREVTEAKNIILLPENPNLQILGKSVEDFFFSPSERSVILKKGGENGWYLTIFDLEKNVESILIEEKRLSKKPIKFLDLKWSFDSKKILLETLLDKEKKYFILEINETTPSLPIIVDLSDAEKVSFDYKNYQKLFFLKNGQLFEIDYKTKTISEPIINNLITYEILNDNIFYLDSSGFLFSFNLLNNNQEKINSNPFPIKEGRNYKIFIKLPEIFLKEDNSLYRLNLETKGFEKLFEPLVELKFSDDSNKMIFFNDYEIWVRYLKDILEQPFKKAGDQQLIARFSEKIENCFWLNNYYLIFNVGEKIKIAEIDERDKIQIWDLINFKNPNIYFNKRNKSLYLTSEENFYIVKI